MSKDFYFQESVLKELKKIRKLLEKIYKKEIKMDAELEVLIAQVAVTQGIEQSAITLIAGIAAQLADLAEQLADEPIEAAKILEMSNNLKASSDALAAAVAANPLPPIV
jgi:hypothetical protein